ncbi:MAG: zinc dependent phospholipase C family protein [Leptospiraceae bacterium]|nr:zinc dependent phospholipase C family protein [Leptospiraceae bacterium]
MAGKITHIEVLAQTVKHLDHGTNQQRSISNLLSNQSNANYANLGTIAPDIFYYYHILSPSKITSKAQIWGDLHHHQNVTELVLNFLDLIIETEEGTYRDRMIAFVLGYICHCAVDIVTHPYIFFISGDYYSKDPEIASLAQYNHMRVEYALDSYLLDHRWGMSPKDYDFTHYIDVRKRGVSGIKKIDPMIWFFWLEALRLTFPNEFKAHYLGSVRKIIPGDIINDSYIGYIRFNEVLDSRNSLMRNFLKAVDFIPFSKKKASTLLVPFKDNIDMRILNSEGKEWFYPADANLKKNHSFIALVNLASNAARDAITIAWEYLKGNVKRDLIIKEYGGYNLDTGLRYQGISEMKEFAPL